MDEHELYDPHDQAQRQSWTERFQGRAFAFLQAMAQLSRWQRRLLIGVGMGLVFIGEIAREPVIPSLVAGLLQVVGWILIVAMLLVGQQQARGGAGLSEEWSRLKSAYQEAKAQEQANQEASRPPGTEDK